MPRKSACGPLTRVFFGCGSHLPKWILQISKLAHKRRLSRLPDRIWGERAQRGDCFARPREEATGEKRAISFREEAEGSRMLLHTTRSTLEPYGINVVPNLA